MCCLYVSSVECLRVFSSDVTPLFEAHGTDLSRTFGYGAEHTMRIEGAPLQRGGTRQLEPTPDLEQKGIGYFFGEAQRGRSGEHHIVEKD